MAAFDWNAPKADRSIRTFVLMMLIQGFVALALINLSATCFITGDRLEITRVDADGQYVTDNLDFVAADAWSDNAQHLMGLGIATLIKLAGSGFITAGRMLWQGMKAMPSRLYRLLLITA